jgi:hypothetical protein
MAPVSYQTITLSKGKHDSPQDGACVMELASMLASEPFSDRPHSVCPVIGSFLRAYNDRIDDARRQDLYTYAAKVLGSRASQDVQHARAERLRAWALERHWSGWLQRLVPARLRAWVPTPPVDLVGSHAVCAIRRHDDKTHAEVLALIDELLTIDSKTPPSTRGVLGFSRRPAPVLRTPIRPRVPNVCPTVAFEERCYEPRGDALYLGLRLSQQATLLEEVTVRLADLDQVPVRIMQVAAQLERGGRLAGSGTGLPWRSSRRRPLGCWRHGYSGSCLSCRDRVQSASQLACRRLGRRPS